MPRRRECWGGVFLNRGESLLCNPFFLEENQTLTQAPFSLGTTGSAIPFSLDAIPLYSQGLGQYLGAGAVQTGISTAPPTDTAPLERPFSRSFLAGTCPPQIISS